MDFQTSRTKENLMRAFAGESQARNRYTFAAATARQNKLHVVEAVFLFTANQEKEHAEVFYNFLSPLAGETIAVDGTYPIDISGNVAQLLRSAQHNEFQEFETDYAEFAKVAQEEGFDRISNTFHMIANVEKTHGDRFGMYANMLEQNQLFVSNVETQWMCLNCGHIYKGTEAPKVCPVCNHDQGYFIRLELAPYTKS